MRGERGTGRQKAVCVTEVEQTLRTDLENCWLTDRDTWKHHSQYVSLGFPYEGCSGHRACKTRVGFSETETRGGCSTREGWL
jgi:hypothetical protein